MQHRKENARRSDQTRRAKKMSTDIDSKYITPLVIIGGAILAYPIVDWLTNMPSLNFVAMTVLLAGVAIAAGAVTERGRCSR